MIPISFRHFYSRPLARTIPGFCQYRSNPRRFLFTSSREDDYQSTIVYEMEQRFLFTSYCEDDLWSALLVSKSRSAISIHVLLRGRFPFWGSDAIALGQISIHVLLRGRFRGTQSERVYTFFISIHVRLRGRLNTSPPAVASCRKDFYSRPLARTIGYFLIISSRHEFLFTSSCEDDW